MMFILFVDVQECLTDKKKNICTRTCSNKNGYVECSCKAGYSLQGDGVTCEGTYAFIHIYTYIYVYYINLCNTVWVSLRVY